MKRMIGLCLLLLLFPLSIQAKDVILGGDSIGLQLDIEGLMITQTYTINDEIGQYNPIEDDIQAGDLILKVNETTITSLDDFSRSISSFDHQQVILTLNREGKIIHRQLKVLTVNGQLKTGLFLKEEALGIGTLTFIDPKTMEFGTLGHEVNDESTKKILKIDNGTMYSSQVLSIRKALLHQAGEKQAQINFKEPLGTIHKNTPFGVYGKFNQAVNAPMIETATQDEIQLDEALMYTVLDNHTIDALTIMITKNHQEEPQIKSFEFIVTDKKCLNVANGIVQGMSGSPIVQNGKLIGAVTHVSSAEPKIGYGVYIEWMIQESENDFNRQ